jgi:hypothetical protein
VYGAGVNEFPVVALVASAGGLDAVARVLERLPEDFGASVIVLIHQPPDRVSRLVDILDRRCTLPVAAAGHDLRLAPGQVFVVPPGKHLLITPSGRTAPVISGPAPPSRPSADLLLATLATALGARAITVILSGSGRNGATGATACSASPRRRAGRGTRLTGDRRRPNARARRPIRAPGSPAGRGLRGDADPRRGGALTEAVRGVRIRMDP